MKSITKVYISGLGAVGCAYASKLHDLDKIELKIIANHERIERYQKSGIQINEKKYNFQYVLPEAKCEKADLILIAVKHHHLAEAVEQMKNFVREDTVILSLLNGISSEESIGKIFGIDKLLYSFCVGTDTVREGTKIRFSNIGRIVFGEKSNLSLSPKVQAVKALLEDANIPFEIPENMLQKLWWKFMMNVGINQVSAVLKAPYKVFQEQKEARELLYMTSKEVVSIASKLEIPLSEQDIDAYIKIIETLAPEGKTSMLQDVEAKRKTEVEIFAGTVIELGQRYGIETPLNHMLLKMIQTLEIQQF